MERHLLDLDRAVRNPAMKAELRKFGRALMDLVVAGEVVSVQYTALRKARQQVSGDRVLERSNNS